MTPARRTGILLGCIAAIGLICWINYQIGVYISLVIFLLIPISVAAWFLGPYWAYVIALLSAAGRFILDVGLFPPVAPVWMLRWDVASKSAFFVIFAYVVLRLRRALDSERRLARIDTLTGAYTRHVFYDFLEREIATSQRSQRPLALAYIDLDNFKTVNDSRGHAAGDDALRLVARTVHGHVRRGELLGRLGGDEFALLMRDADAAGAHTIVERLRQTLLDAMRARGLPITFSIGVCVYDGREPISADQFITAADELMYEVKHTSKNAVRIKFVAAALSQSE